MFEFLPQALQSQAVLPYLAIAMTLWTLPWKGWALWLAARRGEFWWFVAILILNTLAVLEIVYIFFIAKRKDVKEEKESAETPAAAANSMNEE